MNIEHIVFIILSEHEIFILNYFIYTFFRKLCVFVSIDKMYDVQNVMRCQLI